MRHPFALGLETSVTDRLAVAASLSDGIGLGLKVGLLSEGPSPFDLGIGFDELLFPVESHLFGRDSQDMAWVPGRAWVGVAQTWEFLRARGALSMRPGEDGLDFVPHFALETAFKLPFSVGWESSWEDGTWRQSLGISATLKPVVVSFGLSEFQAWILRDGSFGWYDTPPRGKLDGFDNPGWWVSVKWDLPPLRDPAPVVVPVVKCPTPVLDANTLQPVVDLLQQRLLRADVSELAVRAGSLAETDPVAMSVLRRRILAGGASARQALWRIALDPQVPPEERRQSLATLGETPVDSDLSGLQALSEEPWAPLRLETAMVLGRIAAPGADKILLELERDPDESVRLAAKVARELRADTSP